MNAPPPGTGGVHAALLFFAALFGAAAADAQAVCPTVPPALVAPAEGTAGVSSPVEFRWNAVATGGAELLAYRVHVYLQSGEDVVVAETKETAAFAALPIGTHQWAVEAAIAGCPALVSAKNRFTVAGQVCPPKGPDLVAPADGAVDVVSPVVFSWGEIAGAPAYRLMISIDGSPFEGRVTQQRSATVFLPQNAKVAWFVDTALEGCQPVVSSTRHFVVSAASACPTGAPDLVVPPAGATISRGLTDPPVELIWTAVPNAASYTLVMTVTTDVARRFEYANLQQPIFIAEDLRNGSVEWSVRANFEGCPSIESAPRQFTVTAPAACQLAPPAVVSPPFDAKTSSPLIRFAWTESPGAAEYRLWVKPAGLEDRVAAVVQGLAIEMVLELGVIEWSVEAFREGCAPARSQPGRVTIEKATSCEPARPKGLHPAHGESVTSPVQFSWEAAAGALGYTVFVSHQGGRPTPIFDPARPGELITTTSLRADLPPGESIWFVESIFAGCPPTVSEPIPFLVGGCEGVLPFLANPRPGARVTSPVDLLWTPVKGATSYEVFASVDGAAPKSLGTRTDPGLLAHFPTGGVVWWVGTTVEGCGAIRSPESAFAIIDAPACGTPERPQPGAPGQVSSKVPYRIRWDPIPNAGSYEIEESLTPDFATAAKVATTIGEAEFSHDAIADTAYYYRVRAKSSCDASTSEASASARVVVLGPASSSAPAASADAGSSDALLRSIAIPGAAAGRTFRASTGSSWIKLPVASGTVPPEGLTLSFTADPASLPFGTNQGEITIELSGAGTTKSGQREGLDGAGTTTVPVSVTIVTPVTKKGKSAPPPEALIIPAVIHAPGANDSKWRSDIRILNPMAHPAQVQITFTPTVTDGTASGYRSTISIGAGESTALDAVLKNWFGLSSLGSAVSGSLEVRPLLTGTGASGPLGGKKTLPLLASSRTYNETSAGTYGQFVPAIPFRDFAGGSTSSSSSATKLSIQQIAQSSRFRTNLGIVEGAGEKATITISAYDRTGAKLATEQRDLAPGQHLQINGILGATPTENGRLEVEVASGSGRIHAYGSVVDNDTNDPILVPAVNLDRAAGDHQVLAGIADYDTGIASWRSDVRLFNAGASAETATLTFYPSVDPASSKAVQVTLDPGEIEALDDILDATFGVTNSGGSIHVRTAATAKVIASARTYNQTSSGTYGQFLPAFREEDGIAKGDPPLQILQIEQSKKYRTNVGLFEMSGKRAVVEVSALIPGSPLTAKYPAVELDPYEFIQLVAPLKVMGVGSAYNTRLSLRVKEGDGVVAAYASVIDESTQDPIYVPSQQ